MNSRTTAQFRERLAHLPADVRAQARAAYRHFQQKMISARHDLRYSGVVASLVLEI